jgi:hypothetical protein
MAPRFARLSGSWIRAFLGARPSALLPFFAPTLLAIAMDLTLRARALAGYAPQGKAIYLSSWLISAAFWVLPLWVGARLFHQLGVTARFRGAARAGLVLFFALWLLPFATLCYGGQALYYQVFHSYVGRDTVRLGIELRGTVRDWFVSWGSPLLFGGMLLAGVAMALGMLAIMRRPSFRCSRSWARSCAAGRTTWTAASCRRPRPTPASSTASCTWCGR